MLLNQSDPLWTSGSLKSALTLTFLGKSVKNINIKKTIFVSPESFLQEGELNLSTALMPEP